MTTEEKYIAFLETIVTENRSELYKKVLSNRTKHIALVLEDLYQKHNWSAVVRSCDVFGIQDIYTIENNYSVKLSNGVGKGSQKWVDFHRFRENLDNTQQCIDALKANGYQIVATSPHENSNVISDFDITKKTAFVFGAEKRGVSETMMQQADACVKIPMVGFTESLNISVAAAIILQNTTERLRNSTVNWQLTQAEQSEIYLRWLEGSITSIKPIKERFYKELGEV